MQITGYAVSSLRRLDEEIGSIGRHLWLNDCIAIPLTKTARAILSLAQQRKGLIDLLVCGLSDTGNIRVAKYQGWHGLGEELFRTFIGIVFQIGAQTLGPDKR